MIPLTDSLARRSAKDSDMPRPITSGKKLLTAVRAVRLVRPLRHSNAWIDPYFLRSLLWVAPVFALATSLSAASVSLRPAGREGFDLLADGKFAAPVRLSSNGAILADTVEETKSGVRLSGLRCKDPLAVSFAADSYISVALGSTETSDKASGSPRPAQEPVVRFKLSLAKFDAIRWRMLFPDGAAPFHFLICSMPTALVWHQRGWLNATPNADPFPLLQDMRVDTPEISCKWNRNWGYLCPLGAHPVPMIGVWDPAARLYVGYDFQDARATDQFGALHRRGLLLAAEYREEPHRPDSSLQRPALRREGLS
jgi:hypothetical protein